MLEAEPVIFGVGVRADCVVERNGEIVIPQGIKLDLSALDLSALPIGGHFIVECYDSLGNLRWEDTAENGVTDVGIAALLNIMFRAQAQIGTWYIGIIDNAGFTAFASGDTMTTHAGWSEIASGSYSNANRVQWIPGAPSGGAIVNATTSDFAMTPPGALTVKGLFLVSDSTKGGTAGTLFATAAFTGGTQGVNNGDTLKVTYTVSAVSG